MARSNAELQQFACAASHDLQEPLRKVTSYLEVLATEYGGQLDEQARQYIHIASDAAARMQVGECDARALVEALIEDFEITLRDAGGEIEFGELPVIPGDGAHLRQVFRNLLSNAVKYRGTLPLRVQICAVAEPGGWHFTVRDNGIGFEQAYRRGEGHRSSLWSNLGHVGPRRRNNHRIHPAARHRHRRPPTGAAKITRQPAVTVGNRGGEDAPRRPAEADGPPDSAGR